MVVHTCNHSTWEAEAGGSQIEGQSGLPSKAVSEKIFERKVSVTHAYNPSYLRD
jgi:hypothetical protein